MSARSSARSRPEKGSSVRRLQLTLERSVQAPAVARAEVTECCRDLGIGGSLCQSLILLVSEVVSNAVRHSTADPSEPVGFVASFGERAIRVTVSDAGEGFTPRPRDPARTHDGYGLYLLEKVADRWGVDSRGGTRVWFELARSAA